MSQLSASESSVVTIQAELTQQTLSGWGQFSVQSCRPLGNQKWEEEVGKTLFFGDGAGLQVHISVQQLFLN